MERRPKHVHEQRAKVGDSSLPLPAAVKRLLPTPNAWDGERGADFARAGRDESGGDDLMAGR